MENWKNEAEAREQIKALVAEYNNDFKKPEQEKAFKPGDRLSYASRVYDEKEMCSLVDAALDFWLTTGRFSDEFEKKFAEWIGVKYANLVNSGSSANLIAFMALTAPELGERQIKKGDEVITVAAGFPTTITPALQYGVVPVFVEFCDKHNLWLVEDNCDALGTKYTIDGETRFSGTWGDIGTSSFYPPHHMTMGEGGCVYTNTPLLNRLIKSFRDWGRDCICSSGRDNMCGHRFDGQHGELPFGYDHKYVYSHFGYNLKATDMQAAIGCAQLEKFPSFVERRKHNFNRLKAGLKEVEDKLILPTACENSRPSWFGFLITCKEGVDRNKLVQEIEARGVQTRMLFAGNLTKHPCFDQMRAAGKGYRISGSLENTDRIMKDTFWIGVYPGMTDEMLSAMADAIKEALN